MDNLTLDEEGIVSLVRGTVDESGPHFAHVMDMFSIVNDTRKTRFAGLYNGHVLVDGTTLFTGGSWRTGFGSALGQTLICSGFEKKKFDTDERLRDLGIKEPEDPLKAVSAQPSFFDIVGADNTEFDEYHKDTETSSKEVAGSWNTLFTSSGESQMPEQDNFEISIQIQNTKDLISATVIFYTDYAVTPVSGGGGEELPEVPEALEDPPPEEGGGGGGAGANQNYFQYVWENGGQTPFNLGQDRWTRLRVKRGDFKKVGDNSKGWDEINGYRVVLQFQAGADSPHNRFNAMRFVGGSKGNLNGWYDYVQVNVYNSGLYEGKSKMGPILSAEYVENGYMEVTPVNPNNIRDINEVWIYRRNRPAPDEFRENFPTGVMDRFYRVKVLNEETGFDKFEDTMSDVDAMTLNIRLNHHLKGVKDCGDVIFAMEGLYYDRMLFLGENQLFVGDVFNLDAIDERFTIKLSGNPSEQYLWITKVTNGVVLLATTNDIYELAGTFVELPDGTLDLTIRALGEAHPPIGEDFAKSDGAIFYYAADGWRVTNGSNSVLISQGINSLWGDEMRHEYIPVSVKSHNIARAAVAVAKNKLWTCVPLQDGTRSMMVYDLERKTWHSRLLDPFMLYTEADGTLLGGFGGGAGNFVRKLDTGPDLSGINGQEIRLWTVFDDFGLPRNRKDVFTFKITFDSGGKNIQIEIAKSGQGWISLGNISASGKTEHLITIAETVGMSKAYAIRITGQDLKTFKLYNWSIEYEPRPEQLTYFRIPHTNLGTASRKRFVNFAFVIDTLGTDCEFFPLIDGEITYPSSTLNLNRKGTHIHYFFPQDTSADEFVGTDIGGIICGFFEFYGVNLDEIVSEKLPVPVKFLLIPADDYGTPNRKRHSSYKFQINTRGFPVEFTPRLDGQWKQPTVVSTNFKQTVEYFFTEDTFGIDIGGRLSSLQGVPFEFYGVIRPQTIEVMPDRLLEFRIPENNYGVGARKRIRTMPMELNTNGGSVMFVPIVDNQRLTPSLFNTPNRTTVFHYFDYDVFGVDFSGELFAQSETPFEFYGLMKPAEVEVLPVPKRFDQIGPFRFDKLGTLLAIRIRGIFGDGTIAIKVLNEMEATLPSSTGKAGEWVTTIQTLPNQDEVYEISVPKTVNGTVFRVEIGPSIVPFHRYDIQLKLNMSGMDANPKWINLR